MPQLQKALNYIQVNCNKQFQLDAAGNNRYKRECIYDPDLYESEWFNPIAHSNGVAYQARFEKLYFLS